MPMNLIASKMIKFTGFVSALALIHACDNTPVVAGDCTTDPTLCAASSTGTIDYGSSSSTTNVGGPVLPTMANPAYAAQEYAEWKAEYVINQEDVSGTPYVSDYGSAAGSSRVIWDTKTQTVSEGIGYGMLNAYFAGDYTLVRRFYKYHQAFRQSSYLMGWKAESFSSLKAAPSATDADVDVATALILTAWATADFSLIDQALLILNDIWNAEIDQTTFMVRPGDVGWPASGQYNASYISPVAFRIFALVDPSHNWTAVLNKGYEYLATVQANGNGLFADWTDTYGQPVIPKNNDKSTNYNRYGLESIRIPWRLGWDWLWFGEPRAKAILDKMAAYMTTSITVNNGNIFTEYPFVVGDVPSTTTWNSVATSPRTGMYASICAMGIASPEAYGAVTNACLTTIDNLSIAAQAHNYFHDILHVMYSQMLNGMYVKPAGL